MVSGDAKTESGEEIVAKKAIADLPCRHYEGVERMPDQLKHVQAIQPVVAVVEANCSHAFAKRATY